MESKPKEAPVIVELQPDSEVTPPGLDALLSRMRVLRKEDCNDPLTNELLNEYLIASRELGGMLTLHEDPKVREKVGEVVQSIRKDPTLLQYDHAHDAFWRRVHPEVMDNLDYILFSSLQDGFSSMKDAHHFLSALKFLTSDGEEKRKKQEVCDTVIPFPQEKDNSLLEHHLTRLGFKYGKNGLYKLYLKNENKKRRKQVFDLLGDFGEGKVQVEIRNRMVKDHDRSFEQAEDIIKKKLKLWKRRMIKLSYPLLGMMPENYANTFQARFGRKIYDKQLGNIISGRVVGSTMLGLLGITVANIWSEGPYFAQNLPYFIATGLLFIGEGPRVFSGEHPFDYTSYTTRYGTTQGYIASWIHSAYKSIPFIKKRRVRIFNVSTRSQQSVENGYDHPNLHKLRDTIASTRLPQNLEDNLEWSEQNHNTQGEYFKEELLKKAKQGHKWQYGLLREDDAAVFYDVKTSTPYKKISALLCFKNERYALTCVINQDDELDLEKTGKILKEEGKLEDHAQKLEKEFSPRYIHLTQFQKGKEVDNYVEVR